MKYAALVIFVLCFLSVQSKEFSRLLRFPDVYDNQVVFTYAGDLYTGELAGGTARRLTSGQGNEIFAHFSPDGSMIAFTAQYDGNTEVYVMSSEGGTPLRLTYTATLSRDDLSDRMGPNNIVMGWSHDGKKVIYRSRKATFNDFVGHLFMVPVEGGMSEQIPFSTGSWCSFSDDGMMIAFNRVFREFRTWKYYRGGMADDIRIHDFRTQTTENITNNDAQDIFPMWHKNLVYFLSDRDRTMNLFAYDTITKKTSKLTNFTLYDIKFPNIGNNGIIFENGGWLYYYSFEKKNVELLYITVSEDNSGSRISYKNASERINSWSLSPDGVRIAFGARGDVWSVPAEEGISRNISSTSGVHERNVRWSPDGKYIAYISDETGETEVFYSKADGSEKPVQVTKAADTYTYSLKWSPDSKKILYHDKRMRLQYTDIVSGSTVLVCASEVTETGDYNWSPDSKWIAYMNSDTSRIAKIFLFSTETKKSHQITSDWYDSYNPVFSDCGKYLFFVSDRDFNPIYSETEWNHAYQDRAKIYFITLNRNDLSPLAPKNQEVEVAPDEVKNIKTDKGKSREKEKENENSNAVKPVVIDLENIGQRISALPVQAGNYWNLCVFDNKVYYNYSRMNESASLRLFDLSKKEEKNLGNYSSFEISINRKKMALPQSGNYYIIDLPTANINVNQSASVNLDNMYMWVDLQQEWNQIFEETWRQMRDFFYDPGMHGVSWADIRKKYEPLVAFVNNRHDLNYILGEMIGELNIGHAYTGGGECPQPQRVKTGLLGAEISKHESGYFRIDKILLGESWVSNCRSPLVGQGMEITEGDFIIAINGKYLKDVPDIYSLLVGKADVQVEITFSSKPDGKNTRKYIIVPVDSEDKLYYYTWVQHNIDYVNKATNGQVGYIHVPDMGQEGLNEFVKYFYPQLAKKAIIIDDRGNGGGNVSPMLIERLRREVSMMAMGRNADIPYTKPRELLNGPKVLLINQYSASDGDLFPYQFKKHKLGKVIGVRTWGGVVGIRGSLPFIDGGLLMKPEFAHYSAEGKGWIIEGYGVDPDIYIDNDPYLEFTGVDTQLDKAIEVALEELKNNNYNLPGIPEFPDKSR